MAGPWLFALTDGKGFFEQGPGVERLSATLQNFRSLIRDETIKLDRFWRTTRNGKHVVLGDQMYLYWGGGVGIVGCATIVEKVIKAEVLYLVPHFNIAKTRELLERPIPAATVLDWGVIPRPNVVNLERFQGLLSDFLSSPWSEVEVEQSSLSEEQLRIFIEQDRLTFGDVLTSDAEIVGRRRVGQEALRQLALSNYGQRCAVCDIADPRLLVASHIVGWAESKQDRGRLANVICLCRIHDALFEAGYWALADDLRILKREGLVSDEIRQLLTRMSRFDTPAVFPPGRRFIQHHRSVRGFSV